MDRLTDRPDMTSAVYRGRKALTKKKKRSVLCVATDKLSSYRTFPANMIMLNILNENSFILHICVEL